jgi:hypothetical protein
MFRVKGRTKRQGDDAEVASSKTVRAHKSLLHAQKNHSLQEVNDQAYVNQNLV